jgi:hypothetical protein
MRTLGPTNDHSGTEHAYDCEPEHHDCEKDIS